MTPEQLKVLRDTWEKARFSSIEKVNLDIIYGLQLLDEIDRLRHEQVQQASEMAEFIFENVKLKEVLEEIVELGKKSMNPETADIRSLYAHSFYLEQAIGIATKALEEGK